MKIPRLKNFKESIRYDYSVCEIEECTNESDKITSTEVKFIEICNSHYNKYVLEINEEI